MKLLAHCIPTLDSVETVWKYAPADGIRVYLKPDNLSPDNIEESIRVVERLAQIPYEKVQTVGMEINEGIPKGYSELEGLKLINPASLDDYVRETSQEFLRKIASKFTRPLRENDKECYFQFQAVGDPYKPGFSLSKR